MAGRPALWLIRLRYRLSQKASVGSCGESVAIDVRISIKHLILSFRYWLCEGRLGSSLGRHTSCAASPGRCFVAGLAPTNIPYLGTYLPTEAGGRES